MLETYEDDWIYEDVDEEGDEGNDNEVEDFAPPELNMRQKWCARQ